MPGYRLDSLQSVRTTAASATGTIGTGANGTITITVTAAGAPGNLYTVVVANGVGNDVELSAALNGTAISVTLGTDGAGAADATKNTATLVTAVVDALANVTAATSGSGVTVVPVQSLTAFTGGRDVWTPDDVARIAVMTVEQIVTLEHGGHCLRPEADRLANALGTTLAGLGAAPL